MKRTDLFFLILLFGVSACSSHYEITAVQSGNMTLQANMATRVDVEEIIKPYRDSLDQVMNEVLCQNAQAMVIERPESDLGNWAADVLLKESRASVDMNIDAAMFNTGGLRTALPQGDITRGKLFELMPFDNELVLVTLPYEEVLAMFDYLALKGGEPVSDLTMVIKDGKAIQMKIAGKDLEERPYVILTSDYLSNGGDKMYFFTEGHRQDRIALDIKVRDMIIGYCTAKGKTKEALFGQKDGRIAYGN